MRLSKTGDALWGARFLWREDRVENRRCGWKGRTLFAEPDYRSLDCQHSVRIHLPIGDGRWGGQVDAKQRPGGGGAGVSQ